MIKMTEELLSEFGACGDYLRKFKRLFPSTDERYEDGVDVTGEAIRAHVSEWDWDWASSRMLNPAAQQSLANARYGYDADAREIRDQRNAAGNRYHEQLREWRERFDEPTYSSGSNEKSRQAYRDLQTAYQEQDRELEQRLVDHWTNTLATLLNDERHHSESMKQALVNAARRREENDSERLERAEDKISSLREEVRYWTEEPETRSIQEIAQLEERRAELAEEIERQRVYWVEEPPKKIADLEVKIVAAEEKLVALRERVATRQLRRLEAEVERAQQAVETAQRESTELLARLETARQEAAARLEAARPSEVTVEAAETAAPTAG